MTEYLQPIDETGASAPEEQDAVQEADQAAEPQPDPREQAAREKVLRVHKRLFPYIVVVCVLFALVAVYGRLPLTVDTRGARYLDATFNGERVSVLVAGETLIGGAALELYLQEGAGAQLGGLAAMIGPFDLGIAKLGAPETDAEEPGGIMHDPLRQASGGIADLTRFGFGVFMLAGNHMMDYGERGLADTLAAAAQVDAVTIGAGTRDLDAHRPLVVGFFPAAASAAPGYDTDRPFKVGFYNCAMPHAANMYPTYRYAGSSYQGVARCEEETLRHAFETINTRTDATVALIDWGKRWEWQITREQERFAELLEDVGFDVIIGSGPGNHQQVEGIGKTPVIYSTGIFTYGATIPRRYVAKRRPNRRDKLGYLRWGLPVKLHFNPFTRKLLEVELIPVEIARSTVGFKPGLTKASQAEAELHKLAKKSRRKGARMFVGLTPLGPRGHIKLPLKNLLGNSQNASENDAETDDDDDDDGE